MTGQAFFVLAALADGPRHGYGIVGEVAELSQGRVKLKIGGLYGVLDRLSAEGLIEPDREEAHDGRLRRSGLPAVLDGLDETGTLRATSTLRTKPLS